MKASPEAIESFHAIETRREVAQQHKEAERTQQQQISDQVLRASRLARSGYRGYNNGETVTYNSRWANIVYDAETDIVTQAKLHGVYDTRAFLFTGRLACVHLYLRAANPGTSQIPKDWYSEGHIDYIALFDAQGSEPQITVPKADARPPHFPYNGELVVPETQQWRELDYVLAQVEARPR